MSEWISVKDRMPEKSDSYLVATDRGAIWIARYWKNSGQWSRARLNPHIIDWMPRPAPPKEAQ